MPSTAFNNVSSTGHGPYPPQKCMSGKASTVFVNGKTVLVVGDSVTGHQKPPKYVNYHTSSVSSGSGSVFANGIKVARIGDAIGCGSSVAQGSSNVFTGG